MKYIKRFNESNLLELTKIICEELYDTHYMNDYTINPDGTIDVMGNVNLSNFENMINFISTTKGIKITYNNKLPIKFNKVSEDFYCDGNNLNSLEGCPKEVGGYFVCGNNELTSLKGSPNKVGKGFDCSSNKLTTLEGSPKEVGGSFLCYNNHLTSVRGFPEDYEGDVYIFFNKKGGGNSNKVTEILYLIQGLYGSVYINRELIGPGRIIQLLNEYDVISLDGKKVYRNNLEEVFNIIGLEMPNDLKFENYEIS